jgi:hypothetical protein
MNQNKPFLSLSLFISGTCFSNRKPTNTLLFFEHITNCVPYSNYMPPKSLVGMRLGRIGSHPWAATKASHLLFLHHQFCLWVHLDKRFYHCKMFEKLCSRILGSANLSLYFLLVALIEFVNQWSLCVNCPPFPGTTKLKPQLHFLPSLIWWAFLLLPGIPGTWNVNSCCFQKLPLQATKLWHLLGKIPPRSHRWHFWERSQNGTLEINKHTKQMAPVEALPSIHSAELYCQCNDLPVSLGHYDWLLEPFNIISYSPSLALDTGIPYIPSQGWFRDIEVRNTGVWDWKWPWLLPPVFFTIRF